MSHLRLLPPTLVASHGLPPLIPRPGLHDEQILIEFEGSGMSVIGRTIAQAKQGVGLARIARDRYGAEVLIDPETWRNQYPVEDRTVGFMKASFALDGVLDLERRTLSRDEMSAYISATLQELRILRATTFVAPYHLGRGPDCPIRSSDLTLARRTAAAFRSLRLDESPGGERFPVQRRLLAAIAIRPGDLLDPLAREMLVQLYSAIDVDGYLLKVVDLSEHSSFAHATASAEFAFSLLYASGRDVILGGGRNLALAFVAAGLPAAMMGIAEGETFNVGSGGRNHGSKPIYSAPLWRSVSSINDAAKLRAEILFARNPCDCGHHHSNRLPNENQRQLKLHTLTERLQDFREVASWSDAEAGRKLTARLTEIDTIASNVGYPDAPRTYIAVAQAAQRVRLRRGIGFGSDHS